MRGNKRGLASNSKFVKPTLPWPGDPFLLLKYDGCTRRTNQICLLIELSFVEVKELELYTKVHKKALCYKERLRWNKLRLLALCFFKILQSRLWQFRAFIALRLLRCTPVDARIFGSLGYWKKPLILRFVFLIKKFKLCFIMLNLCASQAFSNVQI